METFSDVSKTLSLALGAAWASGINLYAAILVLGLLGISETMILPENLQLLAHPAVIGVAGLMYLVEFAADKTPGFDTGWDALHTFIRIPAGALLAAGAVGDIDPSLMLAAGMLGGGIAAGSHALKAGTRVMINASPEPFSNWIASISEDILVVAGLWAALYHPFLFLIFLIAFIALLVWLLPKLWRGIKTLFASLQKFFSASKKDNLQNPTSQSCKKIESNRLDSLGNREQV